MIHYSIIYYPCFYVARQYLGNIRKIDNEIVSVNVYGIYQRVRANKWCKFTRIFNNSEINLGCAFGCVFLL